MESDGSDPVNIENLYSQILQLTVENDFLKNNLKETGSMSARVHMVKPDTPKLSIRRQCNLLSISRSQLYYTTVGENAENIKMMRIMDEHLINHTTEGVLSMVYLLRDKGFIIGLKRLRRLIKLMGRETIYRRKNLTKMGLREYIKPYLLRGLKVDRPNQVWYTDITYI